MAMIEVQKVNKIYNTTAVPVHALKDVTLSIDKKEFAAVVGPSGSGKTTLLNTIGGLDKVSDGKVYLNGEDITSMNEGKLIDF
ncbi:MAG TPA: ATP-binding cassette domain-containing protein, partial [Ignavibacteriaceae bacterium]|nr:ATP-binding cassette domain-containing protein [Ignavibacteriaceae bacterium]